MFSTIYCWCDDVSMHVVSLHPKHLFIVFVFLCIISVYIKTLLLIKEMVCSFMGRRICMRMDCQDEKNVSTPLDKTGVAFHWSIGVGVLACPSPPTRDCYGSTCTPRAIVYGRCIAYQCSTSLPYSSLKMWCLVIFPFCLEVICIVYKVEQNLITVGEGRLFFFSQYFKGLGVHNKRTHRTHTQYTVVCLTCVWLVQLWITGLCVRL